MLALSFASFDAAFWATWAPVGAGALVAFLVLGSARAYRHWRQRLNYDSFEEDLPWDKLLSLLQQRNRDRAAAGLPPAEATDEEFDQLLARLPLVEDGRPTELPEDREFKSTDGSERRAGRRRWGNPTEVHIISSISEDRLHGIVVNRSTGGLGVYTDQELPAGTLVTIRAIEAPGSVPSVFAEIRHCRKVGKGFVLGCQFRNAIPWTVRVWFG